MIIQTTLRIHFFSIQSCILYIMQVNNENCCNAWSDLVLSFLIHSFAVLFPIQSLLQNAATRTQKEQQLQATWPYNVVTQQLKQLVGTQISKASINHASSPEEVLTGFYKTVFKNVWSNFFKLHFVVFYQLISSWHTGKGVCFN